MKLWTIIAATAAILTLEADARGSGPQPEEHTDLIQRGVSICSRGGGQRGLIPQGEEGADDGYRE